MMRASLTLLLLYVSANAHAFVNKHTERLQGAIAYDYAGCEMLDQAMRTSLSSTNAHVCAIKDYEILPNQVLAQKAVSSAAECKSYCESKEKCEWYTVVTTKLFYDGTQKRTCYLKEKASYRTSPVFTIRHYLDSNLYTYESGHKNGCQHSCQEEPNQLVLGCLSSTPYTCSKLNTMYSLKPLYYTPLKTESYETLYPCCATKPEAEEKPDYLQDAFFSSEKAIQIHYTGIHSAEQCHSVCISNPRCKSWTYGKHPIAKIIGGACYMYDTVGIEDLAKSEVTNTEKSAKGASAAMCKKDGICANLHDDLEEEIILKKPIANTCSYSNIDVNNVIDIITKDVTETTCPEKCSNVPFCYYSLWKDSACHLIYSNNGYTVTNKYTVLTAMNCNNKAQSPKCIQINKEAEGSTISTTVVDTVTACIKLCDANENCVAWSYKNKNCVMLDNTKPVKVNISRGGVLAFKICQSNDIKRQLTSQISEHIKGKTNCKVRQNQNN